MKRIFLITTITFILFSLSGCKQESINANEKDVTFINNDIKLELPKEFEQYRGKFEKSVKPYIKIHVKKDETLAWESKFGGKPYMPLDYEYPKDINGNPMRLLAQINFDEVPNIDVFPSKGILQFYISAKDGVYGLNFDNPTSQENFKVVYLPEVMKDTSKIISDFSFIKYSEDDYFPLELEGKLQFSVSYAPVASGDFQFEKFFNTTSFNFFSKFGIKYDKLSEWYENEYSSSGHKMAGYAYFTQSDPRENRFSDYEILILQIDTDEELKLMWGDCGVANFFINADDLKKLDFSKVLYNWDCC